MAEWDIESLRDGVGSDASGNSSVAIAVVTHQVGDFDEVRISENNLLSRRIHLETFAKLFI